MRRRNFQLLGVGLTLMAIAAFIGALLDIAWLSIGVGFATAFGAFALWFYVRQHPVE